MIPLAPNSNTVDKYKTKLLNYITSRKRGQSELSSINSVLGSIEQNLTLDDLIVADYSKLQSLKRKYTRYFNSLTDIEKKDRIKSLSILLTYYDKFSALYGPTLMKELKIEVCPYCNRNYIFNAGNKRTSEFDHFIPKSPYKIFAISFFNLIPVCHTCNHLKSNKITKILSPYNPALNINTFKFFPIVYTVNIYGIELKETNILDSKSALDLNNKLKLKKLYSHHSYIVKELYEKSQIYQPQYLQKLKQAFFNNPSIMSPTESDFKRFILNTYGDDNDLYIYPLSKATKDIAEYFGLYQKL